MKDNHSPKFSFGTPATWLMLAISFIIANPAKASSYAQTEVSGLTIKLIDLDASDGVAPEIEGYHLSTRGLSLEATNWDNYQEPTRFTQTVNPSFTPGSASISNSNAHGSISVQGNVFLASGANIKTLVHAYGAPASALSLGTFVAATQDNLNPANAYFRLTPHTRVELSGQIFLEGSMTATPLPYTQTATSLVSIALGQGQVTPVAFLNGLSFYTTITQIEGIASSYYKNIPFALHYTNDSASYIDNFTLQFIVTSVAQTNEISAVPEPSLTWLVLFGAFVLVLKRAASNSEDQ